MRCERGDISESVRAHRTGVRGAKMDEILREVNSQRFGIESNGVGGGWTVGYRDERCFQLSPAERVTRSHFCCTTRSSVWCPRCGGTIEIGGTLTPKLGMRVPLSFVGPSNQACCLEPYTVARERDWRDNAEHLHSRSDLMSGNTMQARLKMVGERRG